MKKTGLLLVLVTISWSQVTLQLRYGGPESVYHVKNVSNATPAVVTVWQHTTGQQQHDLINGDIVYLQFVPGCKEANGYRKVASANQSAGTFTITDLNDQPVTCSYPFDPAFESGLAGKVKTVTLRNTRPRIFLPAGGDLLARSKDPDGSGPQVAPVVTENDIPWQKILSQYGSRITPGCDGETPALCPNEETTLDMGDFSGVHGWAALAAAYVWFADNSRTGYLNLAKYLINHVHRALLVNSSGARPGFGFPCDVTARHCSWGSGADWINQGLFNFGLAYDLIRDQLTTAQRQAFAQKILNGWGGEHDCTNQLQKQPGYANLTQGSKTVTGSGFSVYSPGDGVYFKHNPKWGATGHWGIVVSVANNSEMTVNFISGTSKTAPSPATAANADHYKVMPWDSTRCSATFVAGGHEFAVAAIVPRAVTTLASAITADQTTVTVTNPGSFPVKTPFWIVCESEVMKVTARTGNQFTVLRGQAYSTPAAHSAGRAVSWIGRLQGALEGTYGPMAYYGYMWENNVAAQGHVGHLVVAFALAGDDPRAAAHAAQLWNYYYDIYYATLLKDYWSGPSQGGQQNVGYQWGRWQGTHWRVGLVGRHAFVGDAIEVMEGYFWRGLVTAFLWCPPGTWNRLPHDVNIGDAYSNISLGWTAMAATLWPGTEAAYATYWYRNLSGLAPALTGKVSPPVAAYAPPNASAVDFRGVLPSWSFHTETDYGPSTYYGLVVSKRDWTSSSGMLVAAAGWNWPNDHVLDQGSYVPGGYVVFKGNKLLFGYDNSYGIGGSSVMTPWLQIAGGSGSLKPVTHPPWYSGSLGGQQNQIDRKHGDNNYVYARGNFTASWRTEARVIRNHRHFLHVKTDPEYVVVYDDAQMSSPQATKTNLQYFLRADANQTFSASPDYRDIVFKKPAGAGAMVSTKVLFPDGANPGVTYGTTANVHRVTFDWGSVPLAQMIVVHRVASGTADTMPPVGMLGGLDADSVGFEVLDGANSLAVVFARNGADRSQCSFLTSFTGQGRMLITGLAPGNYRVYRAGQEISGSPFTVGIGDGTLYLEGPGGAYTVSGTPPATLGVDPLSLKFHYTIGQEPPGPQTFQATCTGGDCTVSTTETCSWLSVSPPSGPTPQDFTVNVDPQGMEKGPHSCSIMVSAAALNSPQEVTATLDVAEAGEDPPVGSELSVELIGTTSRQLLVRYGGPGLKRGESCTVELSDRPNWEQILESVEDSGGLARRILAFGNSAALVPLSTYHVRATCGSQSATNQMTTRAAGATQVRTVKFKLRPPARIPAERLRVEYGYGPELGQSVTGSCLGGACQAEVQVQTDRLLYFRYVYLNTAEHALASSTIQVVAVP